MPRERKVVQAAVAVLACSGLIALAVESGSLRRSELVEVFPPFMQLHDSFPAGMSDASAREASESLWKKGDDHATLWNTGVTSSRLQDAEHAKYDRMNTDRYLRGEVAVPWDPMSWKNGPVASAQSRMQGLYQNDEPWNLDSSANRLQQAEKKAYYKLQADRYNRGESDHKYPASETWQMPMVRTARMTGLAYAPPAEWKLDQVLCLTDVWQCLWTCIRTGHKLSPRCTT